MPATLIFCTAYAASPDAWQRRYRPWLDAARRLAGPDDAVLMVDDGSPCLPNWPDLTILTLPVSTAAPAPAALPALAPSALAPAALARSAPPPAARATQAVLLRFPNRLGRAGMEDFPGWYRSFATATAFATAHGLSRVLHIESDAALISSRAIARFTQLEDGWIAPWEPQYRFPEIAIQAASGQGLARMRDFFTQSYDTALRHRPHEHVLPLTAIARDLIGARYGETGAPIPRQADYATQLPLLHDPAMMWWRPPASLPPGTLLATLDFTRAAAPDRYVLHGFSRPDPSGTWMVGEQSRFTAPPFAPGRDLCVTLTARPFLRDPELPRQRLGLTINGRAVAQAEADPSVPLVFTVPASVRAPDGGDHWQFDHPDGAAPHALTGQGRREVISVMLQSLTLAALP